MSDKIPEHELIQAAMEVTTAAAAKVLAGEFLFSERQVGMFTLLVQQEIAQHVGTPELQADLVNQIAELDINAKKAQ